MKSYYLDTNTLLRFLLNDIPEQADKVVDVFQQAKAGKVSLSTAQIVIFEVIFILEKYYHFSKEKIIIGIEGLLASPYLEVQDRTVFQEALEIYKAKFIDFVDCFLICKARENNSTLFTFDKNLSKLVSTKI